MLSISLTSQDEYRWNGDNPAPTTFTDGVLYHQWRTGESSAPIIVNTHNTGSGKTKAALLRLLRRAQEVGAENLLPERDDVLVIAPTNELLAQHARDIEQFCKENAVLRTYDVLPVTASLIDEYKERTDFSEEPVRRSAALHFILNDSARVHKDPEKRATIFVVNPDIFYYATYFGYNKNARWPLFQDFFHFNYIIIDELHYYDPKQFAAFLFFIFLSRYLGYFESRVLRRQICILTATPRPQVSAYLKRTGINIEWISPDEEHIRSQDRPLVQPLRALAGAQLTIYSTEELREDERIGGLARLVERCRGQIKEWVYTCGYDGAIISDSLGSISTINQILQGALNETDIGRITGGELAKNRHIAKYRKLILATPTVDIGYNFERAEQKLRQNIDFLLLDAYTGDALVQRIGRAARVLGKAQKDETSHIFAVVDAECYKVLQDLDGQTLSRQQFNALAEQMPRKNDLYAYMRSGAIIEAFRTIRAFEQSMSDDDKQQLDTFFQELQLLFMPQEGQRVSKRALSFVYLSHYLRIYEQRKADYGTLHTVSPDVLEQIALTITQKGFQPSGLSEEDKCCFEQIKKRILQASRRQEGVPRNRTAAIQWIRQDLVAYFKDDARFHFRDSFQPPLVPIYDPEHLHSAETFANYSTLHFIRYYEAQWYTSWHEWREAIGPGVTIPALVSSDAHAYCCLTRLRERPLSIGLKLDARAYTRVEWEEQYAYQVTALHELEVRTLNEQVGLQASVRDIFHDHFVPAFVLWNHPECYTLRELRRLRAQARIYPLPLDVVFSDGREIAYLAVLGNMAFQVCSEMPYWALVKDLRKTIKDDDQPIIC